MSEQLNAALLSFAAKVLEGHREDLADLDGAWLQETAQACGLLVEVPVTEPCAEECRCAEYGDFPQDCLRYHEGLEALLATIREGASE